MKRILLFLILYAAFFTAQAGEVRIAVASNFLATLKMIQPLYEKQHGDRLIISTASTGKLYAQIIHGAPFDLLLAADQVYSTKLEQSGAVVPGSRFVYATGQLVLWHRLAKPINSEQLNAANVKYIAIANPKTAPYGLAAKQSLEAMGLWPTLEPKLVRGESVGQAFQFVASGNAEVGLIAMSQVLGQFNRFNAQYYWPVPQRYYSALKQEAALLKRGQDNPAAIRFLRYLRDNSEARQLMTRYGYL